MGIYALYAAALIRLRGSIFIFRLKPVGFLFD
jgi:hypothetical protein